LRSTSAIDTKTKITGLDTGGGLMKVVFGLSTIAILAKVFGFAEKFVIAHFFGTGDTADVYFAVTSLVLSAIWLVKELVNPSLLPVFASCMAGSACESGYLFRRVFLSAAGLLTAAAAMVALFAGPLTRILVPGFTGAKGQMTQDLLGLLAPAILFGGLSMVAYTVLNAQRQFLKAAWPEAAFKGFVVIGLLALLPSLGIQALALVMGLGALACLGIQLSFIPERRFLGRCNAGNEGREAFGHVRSLMRPLVFGVTFSHLNGLVDNILASTLPAGQLSYLGYAKKLIDALLLVGPVALVTVIYSQLSHLASAHDDRNYTLLVRSTFRLLVYVSVPVACLLVGVRQPLIRVLFERGRFGTESTLGTSQAFFVYALGLIAFALDALLVHSFFAISDTKTPIKIGIGCSFLDVALALVLLRPLQHLGIAWAFVIARTIKVMLLGFMLNRRFPRIFGTGFLSFSGKLALSTAGLWLALRCLSGLDHAGSVLHVAVLDLVLPAAGAASAFMLCSYLLKIEEFRAVVALIRYRKAAVTTLYRGTT